MEKVITIGGKELGFRASALTPRLYRHKLGRDIIKDLNHLQNAIRKKQNALSLPKPKDDASAEEKEAYEAAMKDAQLAAMDLELFENIAWIMARQYDNKTIPGTPEEWLDSMDGVFNIMEILPVILELWGMNQKTTSTPKNA